jgi:hypothetical protein
MKLSPITPSAFDAKALASALVSDLGYRKAADLLVALVEQIDNDLVGLRAGEDMAEGSSFYSSALDAADAYRSYLHDDVFVPTGNREDWEPRLSFAQLGLVK